VLKLLPIDHIPALSWRLDLGLHTLSVDRRHMHVVDRKEYGAITTASTMVADYEIDVATPSSSNVGTTEFQTHWQGPNPW